MVSKRRPRDSPQELGSPSATPTPWNPRRPHQCNLQWWPRVSMDTREAWRPRSGMRYPACRIEGMRLRMIKCNNGLRLLKVWSSRKTGCSFRRVPFLAKGGDLSSRGINGATNGDFVCPTPSYSIAFPATSLFEEERGQWDTTNGKGSGKERYSGTPGFSENNGRSGVVVRFFGVET